MTPTQVHRSIITAQGTKWVWNSYFLNQRRYMMNRKQQVKHLWFRKLGARLIILSLFLGGVAGCAQVATPTVTLATPPPASPVSMPSPAASPEATLPSGWDTYVSQGQCGYAISHPADMQGASQGTYSWTLDATSSEPSGPTPNFVYVSVIPDGFQGQAGEIYNHDPAEANTLLSMQVGESKSVHPDLSTASSFTYTRLPDTTLSDRLAQAYENTQPWEFPVGTKEIRYYLQGNGCTYLVGGYMDTQGSGQPGAINEELFDQIIVTFQLSP
jgi:hypothetical protein